VVRANYATKQADVTDLEELEGLLSPFQVEKLTYFFNQFFDFNEDGKIDASDFAGLNERLRKVANWSTEDTEYINMVDNNRVFFECLLEQVLAERNKEGLEERSWAEALAPRLTSYFPANALTKNNRPVQKTLTRGPGQGEPTFCPDLFFPVYYETKVFPGPALIHCHCCPWPSRQAFSSHIPGRGPLQFSKCCSSGLSVLSVQCNCPTFVHLKQA